MRGRSLTPPHLGGSARPGASRGRPRPCRPPRRSAKLAGAVCRRVLPRALPHTRQSSRGTSSVRRPRRAASLCSAAVARARPSNAPAARVLATRSCPRPAGGAVPRTEPAAAGRQRYCCGVRRGRNPARSVKANALELLMRAYRRAHAVRNHRTSGLRLTRAPTDSFL